MSKTLKNKKDRVVTERYLDKKLDKKLESFVTKDYLDEKLDEKLKGFVTIEYLDERLVLFKEEVKDDIVDEFKKETAKVLEGVDEILVKLDTKEKENAAHDLSHKRTEEKLWNNEARLKKLETKI